MLSGIVRFQVRRAYTALAAGNPEPAIRAFAPNGCFIFPGSHAVAADRRGRDEIADWFRRFATLSPRFDLLDVVVGGWPWKMRVAIRFRDRIGSDYENEGMQYVVMRWGRIVLDRIYLDTQAVAAWVDRHPAESHPFSSRDGGSIPDRV